MLYAVLAGAAALAPAAPVVGRGIVTPSGYTLAKPRTERNSSLYSIDGTGYVSGAPMLLVLGENLTRYEAGYDAGALLGAESAANYEALLSSLLGGKWWQGPVQAALELVVDWQWDKFLSKHTPQDYLDEMRGFGDAAAAAGVKGDMARRLQRAVLLANAPGDLDDVVYVLLAELEFWQRARLAALLAPAGLTPEAMLRGLRWSSPQCSMWGAWGSRTAGGQLFSGRNLDWNQNTGLDVHKIVVVFRPQPPARAHAIAGFAGLFGALVGMSAAGITVHEANLESDRDSFKGFPWILRLRYIMENAADLQGARALWDATQNTVGFNHAIGSAADPGMLLMETDAKHTAYFTAGETAREPGALPEAAFRTNHGFDPDTVRHYQWNGTHADVNSRARYDMLRGAIAGHAARGELIGAAEAANITAFLGQKSEDLAPAAYAACDGTYSGGSNVLSVAYAPAAGKMYAAWEDGAGDAWVPAACNAFVEVDLARWW